MDIEKIKMMMQEMTLEEKAGMCSGLDFWHLKGMERLGIPPTMVTDGPHGLRKQNDAADHLGLNESVEAVCFPAGCATAASFDRDLIKKMGEALGKECQAENISTILGPAVNIKRSPLCGRNFEYYSEDPYVTSEMAAAFIEGVQSQNVGTSIKHFLANNQEKRRMTSSSEVDERTLREIYLAAFEGAVKKGKPWTVMSSYNRLNGKYVGEDEQYLTGILRKEWGFDGYVVSDWGAVNDRVEALKAGLDLEMPGGNRESDTQIAQAVKSGELDEEVLDKACERILNILFRYMENKKADMVFDKKSDHELAGEIAEGSIVLLKNEDHVLPLCADRKVAFIGKYAKEPRYQGGGSSHINSWRTESALEAVSELAQVTFAQGFHDRKDEVDIKMQEEAIEIAANADTAVIFAGLPDNFESEGYDRQHLNLPNCQNELIEKICEVQKNVVVVLHNGSPVTMPWKDKVKGILEAYLGGQAVGKAEVNILYGKVSPSGRLPETFPKRLEDTPCYLTYGKGKDISEYREGIFVGYRYYATKDMEVLFPFGHGLSYTTFEESNLMVDKTNVTDREEVRVSIMVKNTGNYRGKEVVQLYVASKDGENVRPVRELRRFEKISLEPGEEKAVTFRLNGRDFSYWDAAIHDWTAETGTYSIQICRNAHDVIVEKEIQIENTQTPVRKYTLNTCIGELMRDPRAKELVDWIVDKTASHMGKTASDAEEDEDKGMMEMMFPEMPLRQMAGFIPEVTRKDLERMLDVVNG